MNQSGSRSAPGSAGSASGLARDVELKRVDQLVADHVIGVGERPAERQHDAAAHRFGDAAGAFADARRRWRWSARSRMRRVENQRLPAAQLVVEQRVQARVPALGHARGDGDRLALLRVEVDVEVLGLQDLKVEVRYWTLLRPKSLCAGASADVQIRRTAPTSETRPDRCPTEHPIEALPGAHADNHR